MDSMRHLSTSLPTTRRRQDQPELLADFRAAALSVTNLYKSAAASQDKARAAGYQDALDDLLVFLDKENLGLMDGEGWRVRKWATERLTEDGGNPKPAGSDDDGDADHDEQRSTSPVAQKKQPSVPPTSSEPAEDNSPRRTAMSEPPQTPIAPPAIQMHTVPSIDDFTFRSSHSYPSNHDRDVNLPSMDLDPSITSSSTPTSAESVRIISRPVRSRHTNHNRQRGSATSTINLNLGAGTGNKRKLPYSDFFDISGFTGFDGRDGKDGGGGRGGKRGRHV